MFSLINGTLDAHRQGAFQRNKNLVPLQLDVANNSCARALVFLR